MYDAESVLKNTAQFAISSAFPILFNGKYSNIYSSLIPEFNRLNP